MACSSASDYPRYSQGRARWSVRCGLVWLGGSRAHDELPCAELVWLSVARCSRWPRARATVFRADWGYCGVVECGWQYSVVCSPHPTTVCAMRSITSLCTTKPHNDYVVARSFARARPGLPQVSGVGRLARTVWPLRKILPFSGPSRARNAGDTGALTNELELLPPSVFTSSRSSLTDLFLLR